MNKRDLDVLLALAEQSCSGQRELAALCGYSLGGVNASVKNLINENYVSPQMQLTAKSKQLLRSCAPARAVLLAADLGLRQPLGNGTLPKALLRVRQERLIDRLITQLHQSGITEIYVVVGYAKEQFEYLIDRYGVELIVNSQYAGSGSLHALSLAEVHLKNCYVVPCDLWCRENPFRKQELYSWYMVSTAQSQESSLRVNRKLELTTVPSNAPGDVPIGISYLLAADGKIVASRLAAMDGDRRYHGVSWEESLYDGERFLIAPRQVDEQVITRIESGEDLRELNDCSAAIALAESAEILNVPVSEIHDLTPLKKGMTNTSFFFHCQNKAYSIRIPTGKTDNLTHWKREAAVHRKLSGCGIAETVVFFDAATGVKLSEYLEGTRPCDPADPQDVLACMQRLRQLHQLNLQTPHRFDLFHAIEFYESAWGDADSLYPDYQTTKQNVFSLRTYIDSQDKTLCLTHLDAVPENFLISADNTIHLIDWEYAAMQDPHMDIAMFCLQALYDRQQVDCAIDAYFPSGCTPALRLKIYCYIAAGGLLWSNWCEYEIRHGAEFGAYSLRQYRYAKEFYRIVEKELRRI